MSATCTYCEEQTACDDDGLCESCLQARTQHDINMTDDPAYAAWWRDRCQQRDVDEYGIDE